MLRLEELERNLSFGLTLKIGEIVPRHQSAYVITGLYFFPGIVSYVLLLFLLLSPELPRIVSMESP